MIWESVFFRKHINAIPAEAGIIEKFRLRRQQPVRRKK
jgi:hypothetical protein